MHRAYKKSKDPIHFVGIGGIGMSGIAEILVRLGFPVSGSDVADSATVQKLKTLGVKIYIGHKAENVGNASVVVVSSAISTENVEYQEATVKGISIVARAEMLAELMRLKYGIAVAGTHGKTSTTSLLATVLTHAETDPTVIVGGKVGQLGGNAKLGQGPLMVAEADESDGSFLKLSPIINIVTNIDNDHLDYYGDMKKLRQSFLSFVNKVPYYGRNILCSDDKEVAALIPQIEKPYATYGFEPYANASKSRPHFQITNYTYSKSGCSFDLKRNGENLAQVKLKTPGPHNALNATAALVVALELELDLKIILEGLYSFSGVGRRFEFKGEMKSPKATIFDDYGHHPTEIAATLKAARQYWGKGRIITAFQPHRFSRTKLCWNDFLKCFSDTDELILLDIYSAGEQPLTDIDSKKLSEAIIKAGFKNVHYAGSLDATASYLKSHLKDDDLLITLGAGTVTQLGPLLL